MAVDKPELQQFLDRVNDFIDDTDWMAISRELTDEDHPLERAIELRSSLINAEKKSCKLLGLQSRF